MRSSLPDFSSQCSQQMHLSLINGGHPLCFVFFPFVFSCHEKVSVTLYFGRIHTRLGAADFQVFRLII